ncbi:MAG: helix-turn-helix domain-containing protein [Paraclostridium bifermentans]|uniref:helix-turn-helix domain-containing protein n=1 Tax=Paraclostridium bifermentans TaxID=1490 RepID=UPI00241CB2EA|nr:helix-turn-helix domain-containing protein [Paraclostridium bifermentans]MBS5952544.1 helix-turn-helix domain-containing protein [Paraclostridium bifermentans]
MNKSYYAIIPANVRYDKDLKANAKLLYGEITALCNEKGYCWASNSYFAELYKVSNETVSRWISQLLKKGYLNSEIIYKAGTREIEERRIYICNIPIDKKINTPCQKSHEGIDENVNNPIDEKVKDNNTYINNTVNSICIAKEELIKEFSKLYKSNIGVINGLVAEQLIEWSELIEVGLFKRAIEICTEKGNLNLGYLKGIIKKWLDSNITTLDSLEAQRLAHNIKNKTNNSISKNKGTIQKVSRNRFHNENQTFTKYTPEELEKILQESQKGKFN